MTTTRRRPLLLLPLVLTWAAVVRAQSGGAPEDEAPVMPPRPRLRRVPRMRFRDADLAAAREALRPTATALTAFRQGRRHGYEQHGYVSGVALPAEPLVLAALRTWGDPNPMDFVWYEHAVPISLTAPAPANTAPVEATARALLGDPEAIDARPPAERDAVRAHTDAMLQAARTRPTLQLFAARCGWADSSGSLAHGLALVAPTTRELYFSHLTETWSD